MYTGLRVLLYSCRTVMKLELTRQFLTKYTNNKFHENPSTESRVVPCGQTDRRTDMTKRIVAFRKFCLSAE